MSYFKLLVGADVVSSVHVNFFFISSPISLRLSENLMYVTCVSLLFCSPMVFFFLFSGRLVPSLLFVFFPVSVSRGRQAPTLIAVVI